MFVFDNYKSNYSISNLHPVIKWQKKHKILLKEKSIMSFEHLFLIRVG